MLESAAYVLIVAGGIVFGIAFLGFCGAFKNKKPLLYGVRKRLILHLFSLFYKTVIGFFLFLCIDVNT